MVEYFRGSDGELTDDSNKYGIQSQLYLLSPYVDDELEELEDDVEEDEYSQAQQTAYFWSRRRQVTAEEIGNIWDFPCQLMLDYDAFDPAIDSGYLLGQYSLRHGDRYRVQNPGFGLIFSSETDGRSQIITSVPDLVRVDYFRFGK